MPGGPPEGEFVASGRIRPSQPRRPERLSRWRSGCYGNCLSVTRPVIALVHGVEELQAPSIYVVRRTSNSETIRRAPGSSRAVFQPGAELARFQRAGAARGGGRARAAAG